MIIIQAFVPLPESIGQRPSIVRVPEDDLPKGHTASEVSHKVVSADRVPPSPKVHPADGVNCPTVTLIRLVKEVIVQGVACYGRVLHVYPVNDLQFRAGG